MTPDSINVCCARHERADLQSFMVETLAVRHGAIPADELAVRCSAWVEATDRLVGRVDEFLVDRESDHITHLVLREGHLWGRKDVGTPISEIARMKTILSAKG